MAKSRTRAKADKAEIVGRKNLIINGAMQVSQRGSFTSASSSSDETYYIDRFEHNQSGVSVNKQHVTTNQPTDISNTKSWKLTATSSGTGFFGARQSIEDYKIFDGRAFTVSAYIKTNHPSFRFYLYNGASIVTSDAAIADGNWHRIESTFYLDASAGNRLAIEILAITSGGSAVSVNSGDYVEFTGVQLELGPVATDFEHRSYGEELALCQRYYEEVYPMDNIFSKYDSGTSYGNITYKHTKRSIPTISQSGSFKAYGAGQGSSHVVTLTVNYATEIGVRLYINSGSYSSYFVRQSDAGILKVDSEL